MDALKINSESPLLSFGLIADVQYADIDDAYNYAETQLRYYRNSLHLLQDAISHWNASTSPISFILQLGDIIDGKNKLKCASKEALDATLQVFKSSQFKVYHMWGNHELYNFDQEFLLKSDLNCNPKKDIEPKAYYDFSQYPGFRVVVLDTYEVSVLGYNDDEPNYIKAKDLLDRKNPNKEKNSPERLHGLNQRFVAFNGAVSQDQLQWLDSVLQKAETDAEYVIVCGHIPLFEPSTCSLCLLWNFSEVLDVLHAHSSNVLAYISGHDHDGGHGVDNHGIHHITMPGIIETPHNTTAFATVHVFKDRLSLIGSGRIKDLAIAFSPL